MSLTCVFALLLVALVGGPHAWGQLDAGGGGGTAVAGEGAGEVEAEAMPTYPVSLRPGFVEGRATVYEFWVQRRRDRTVRVGPREQTATVNLTSRGELVWRVESVQADGDAVCVLRYRSVRVTIEGGGQSQSFDTAGEGEGPLKELIDALAGNDLTFDVAADGTIREVRGVSQIAAGVSEARAVPEDREFVETAARLATLLAAPAQAEEGARWRTTEAFPHERGEVTYDMTFALRGLDRLEGVPLAYVTLDSDLELDVPEDKMPPAPPGADVKVALTDGSCEAQIIWDLDKGEVAGRNTLMTMEIESSVTAPTSQGRLTITQLEREETLAQLLRLSTTEPGDESEAGS